MPGRRVSRPPKPFARRASWPARYLAGASLQQIAAADGSCYSTVRADVLAAGVVLRARGVTAAWHVLAREMLARGMTGAAVARTFGVSPAAVSVASSRHAARRPKPIDPPLEYPVEPMDGYLGVGF